MHTACEEGLLPFPRSPVCHVSQHIRQTGTWIRSIGRAETVWQLLVQKPGGLWGDFFHVFSVDRKCHAGLLCWSDICVVDSGTLSKRQCIAMGYAFEGRRRGRESRFVCWTLASHPDSVTATRRSHAMAWALSSRSFTERSGECIRRTRAGHVKADRWQTV